jgi:NAD(P)-dependent dehydrogenase (short-subunit alcohol dehydrogenase family)
LTSLLISTSPEEDFQCFNTNVFGTLNVTKAFVPYLRRSKGQRTLSNFGSVTSWYGDSGHAIYSGTNWAISGITESLRAELAPFGIAVTVIEPGWFRTSVLDLGVVAHSQNLIPEYEDGELGKLRKMLGEISGKQVGDVAKGCKVLVDVLTMTGVAEGKEIPVRVPLGADAHSIIKGKCESTLNLLREWDGIVTETDYE